MAGRIHYSEERAVANGAPADYYKSDPSFTDRPSHYATVALKSKDGNSVSKVFEKPGRGSAKVSSLPNYNKSTFEPVPKTGDRTPFYKKKN